MAVTHKTLNFILTLLLFVPASSLRVHMNANMEKEYASLCEVRL